MTIYFTADLHFNHRNIIRYCDRPFESVDDMNNALIENWNSVVRPKDEVYVLGDFSFKDGAFFAKKLNGRKYLVKGNHDSKSAINEYEKESAFTWIKPYYELKHNKTKIVLCHYALRVWNKMSHGSIHLYGHSHGSLPGVGKSMDVGVDCWEYHPVSFEKVVSIMEDSSIQKIDHH